MENRIEGTHTDFLQMITEKRAKLLKDGTRETPGSEGIIDAEVTQLTRIYIEKRKATVAQWVALRLLFEVCMWDTGGGVGRCGVAKRRQKNNLGPPVSHIHTTNR